MTTMERLREWWFYRRWRIHITGGNGATLCGVGSFGKFGEEWAVGPSGGSVLTSYRGPPLDMCRKCQRRRARP